MMGREEFTSSKPLLRRRRDLGYRGFQVLEYIKTTIAIEGRAPSYAMICEALDIYSVSDVKKVVDRLERRGLVSRAGSGRVRRIRLP